MTVQGFSVLIDYKPRRVDVSALVAGAFGELLNLVPWGGLDLEAKPLALRGVQVRCRDVSGIFAAFQLHLTRCICGSAGRVASRRLAPPGWQQNSLNGLERASRSLIPATCAYGFAYGLLVSELLLPQGWDGLAAAALGEWLHDVSHRQAGKFVKGVAPINCVCRAAGAAARLLADPGSDPRLAAVRRAVDTPLTRQARRFDCSDLFISVSSWRLARPGQLTKPQTVPARELRRRTLREPATRQAPLPPFWVTDATPYKSLCT